MIVVIIIAVILIAGAIAGGALSMRKRTNVATAYGAMLDARWESYREWCASRVCLGGCGKRAGDIPRDANGVCTEVWITEECCMECWRAGRSTGRSEESLEWTNRFSSGLFVGSMTDIPSFTALDWSHLSGRGDLAAVILDRDCQRSEMLALFSRVRIDGNEYAVKGVESFAVEQQRKDAMAAGLIGPSVRDLYDSTGKLKVTDDIPIFRGSLED